MTATRKPAGRSLADFQMLDQPLKPAEQKLLEACRLGIVADISAERPEAATDDNTVRAAFLRFLALGGDEQAPVHEHGVQLIGAWIEGVLDMGATRVASDLTIWNSYFDSTPVFRGTKIMGTLNFGGCQLPGLFGDELACNGSLLLRRGFIATGKVRLLGAQIAGNFECDDAEFNCKDGDVLWADGMVVEGRFFFRKLVSPVNGVSLAFSHVGCLTDDAESWGERLVLDGFTYDSILGITDKAPTDALTRRAWLDKQSKAHSVLNGDGADFRPQPWKQLAKVLREMGHAEDARQVAIAFEHRLRQANLIGQTPQEWNKPRSWIYRKVSRGGHWLFWVFTGYGYRPLRLLDVILPLVDLQQETSWSPLIPAPQAVWYQELFSFCDWKHFTRLVLWFEILFGWVSSLLLVAVVSGLTKRREE